LTRFKDKFPFERLAGNRFRFSVEKASISCVVLFRAPLGFVERYSMAKTGVQKQ